MLVERGPDSSTRVDSEKPPRPPAEDGVVSRIFFGWVGSARNLVNEALSPPLFVTEVDVP